MQKNDLIRAWLDVPPEALARLGTEVFLPVPLYASKKTFRPLYINRDAYMRIFSPAQPPTWAEMAETLTVLFSTTIEPENADGPAIATAYADYQADPLDLSLSGNLGSGRAYYAGAAFNIKGEKTPLAQSHKRQFSDGLLEMERALWEGLVGISLQGAIKNGLNDVLAVIDMDDLCEVVWRDKPVRRAKVIRIDNGCLDRVTHLFKSPHPLSGTELLQTARSYGQLEADKFIQRITHGTWSPGNISLAGHLIDFDTVSALKGRGPLYSSTRWHHENRFGYEDLGLRIILRTLTEQPRINADTVTVETLDGALQASLTAGIGQGFVWLMGFEDADTLYQSHQDSVDRLAALWQALARKVYAKPVAHSLKDDRAQSVHIFDTSSFFARHPLLVRLQLFDATAAVADMADTPLRKEMLTPQEPPAVTDIEQQYIDAVDAVIGEHYVADTDSLGMLQFAALGFCRKYDALFQTLLQESGADILAVEAAAIARNEDRSLLFPARTVTFRLAENLHGLSPAELQGAVAALVESCRRPARNARGLQVHMRLYREGYFHLTLDGAGRYCIGFHPYAEETQVTEIEWENKKIQLDPEGFSVWLDNADLMDMIHREASLQDIILHIYSQNEHKWSVATPL